MRHRIAALAGTTSITLVVAIGAPAWAGDGAQVDLGFAAGSVVVDVAPFDHSQAIRTRSDGTIVIGGAVADTARGAATPALVQLTPGGRLDDAFGFTGGVRLIDVGVSASVVDFAITDQGSIFGIAEAVDGGSAFLFRVDEEGLIGSEEIDFGNAADRWSAMAVQPNGRIVIAGSVTPNLADRPRTAVARFGGGPFGDPDTSFGNGGLVTAQIGAATNFAVDVAVGPAGDRLAVTSFAFNANIARRVGVLQLLTSNGAPDTAFSTDGKVLIGMGTTPLEPGALAYQANGRIVVSAKTAIPKSAESDPVLLRIRPTGVLDTTFSGDGRAPVTFTGSVFPLSVFVTGNGPITAIGQSSGQNGIAVYRVSGAGALDTTLDGDGRLIIGPPRSEVVLDGVLSSDGTILTAGDSIGSETDLVVSRFLGSGAADETFGPRAGRARYPVHDFFSGETEDAANGVAVDNAGRILLAGVVDATGAPTMQVLRLLPNGYRDPTYGLSSGNGGRAIANFPDAEGTDIALNGNRAVVVGCTAWSSTSSDFAIAKLTASGSPDTSFSGDGHTVVRFGPASLTERATAVAVQADGRIVIAGDVAGDIGLSRLNADGTPDLTFGGTGRVRTDIGTGTVDRVSDVVIQPNGRILVVGSRLGGGRSRIAVLRYRANGSLDTSFSSDGKVVTGIGTAQVEGTGIALRPDGRILVSAGVFGGPVADVAVLRYTAAGVLDATFSTDGREVLALGPGDDVVVGIAPALNNRIIIGGWGGPGEFFAARILPGGGLDTSFGGNGTEYTPFDGPADARAMSIEPATGRIVVVGEAEGAEAAHDFAAARFDQ